MAGRTDYADDEQNLTILIYATPDGRRVFRKERALPSLSGRALETSVSLVVEPGNLGTVEDPRTRDRYAAEAEQMAEEHDPDATL